MLGFISATAAEAVSHLSVAEQFETQPVAVVITALVFTAASFAPFIKGGDSNKASGPFTPAAELLNGRIAMLGLLTMLCIEAQFEKALL